MRSQVLLRPENDALMEAIKLMSSLGEVVMGPSQVIYLDCF